MNNLIRFFSPPMAFCLKLLILVSLVLPLHAQLIPKCSKPTVRKEWRTLSVTERLSYISAVQCLLKKPAITSKSDMPGVTNRFEDFLGTHIAQMEDIHFVGVFYPWHRLLLHAYEKELRACGYNGAQPYWDWTLDTSSPEAFFNSPIFDAKTGFGGNGDWIPGNITHPMEGIFVTSGGLDIPDRTGGGCVPDGPFKGMVNHLGPNDSLAYNPHCVRRDFSPSHFNVSSMDNVKNGIATPNFGTFTRTTELTFHGGGHIGVGGLYGTLTDGYASPGDPIFYLHHANMDRAWWSWQTRNIERLEDISGPLVRFDYNNEVAGNVTLDTKIHVGATVNITTTVRDVMDIEGGRLCYTYDKVY
ncbi:hypothetical protein V2G26_002687 [Clonostachys chloroleuca]